MHIRLDPKQLARLRDYLLAAGGRDSLLPMGAETQEQTSRHPLEGAGEAKAYFDAVAEAMYLVTVGDGSRSDTKHDVVRGALREITAGMIRTAAVDALLTTFATSLREQGAAKRLSAVCKTLLSSPESAEAAFVLAAAVASTSSAATGPQNETLDTLAGSLGIDRARAESLLAEMSPGAQSEEGRRA